MNKLYADELVDKLMLPGEIRLRRGVEVDWKPIPDAENRTSLEYEVEKSYRAQAEAAKNAPAPSGPLTAQQMRAGMGAANLNLCDLSVPVYTKYIEVPTSVNPVPVWMYYPKGISEDRPMLMYMHGGAFVGGSPFQLENECRYIAQQGNCVVVNVDYDLAPEFPWPVPVHENYEVLCWLVKHAREYYIDVNRIYVSGDSAGGNQAAVLAQVDRDMGSGYVRGQILFYPKLIFDNNLLPGDYVRDLSEWELVPEQEDLKDSLLFIGSDAGNAGDQNFYAKGQDFKDPYISPACGDCAGLPRTLFLMAEFDGLRLESEYYAEKLQKAGVEVKAICYRGINHGYFDSLGIIPQTEAACKEVIKFMTE